MMIRPAAGDALLIVDVQVDFVSGSMAIPDAKAIVPVLNRLMPGFATVVLAQDWHRTRRRGAVAAGDGGAGDPVFWCRATSGRG